MNNLPNLSETTKKLLHAPKNSPIRSNAKAIYNMGIELKRTRKFVKTMKNNGRTAAWGTFVREVFGKRNINIIAKALKISTHEIPNHEFRLQPITQIYHQCNQGFWPETKIKPVPFALVKSDTAATDEFKQSELFNNDRHNKDIIENFVLNMGRQYLHDQKVDCLTLTCDRYQMHIDRFFETFAKHVYVIERDDKKIELIEEAAKACPHFYDKKVTIFHIDAGEITLPTCQFIDLDIGGAILKNSNIIKRHAKAQYLLDEKETKVFAFSFASRGGRYGSAQKNFEEIKSILSVFNVSLNGFDGVEGGKDTGIDMPGAISSCAKRGQKGQGKKVRSCKKHSVQYNVVSDDINVYDVVYFTYNDGLGPMGHVAISYKG